MEAATQTSDASEFTDFLKFLEGPSSIAAKAAAASYFRRIASNDSFEAHSKEECIKLAVGLLSLLQMEPTGTNGDITLPIIRLDAAWAITNLVCLSNSMCHVIVRQGAIPVLCTVAQKELRSSDLKMQCYWAIGNIAADCSSCKLKCRATNIAEMLSDSLDKREFRASRDWHNVVWCILNIVRGGVSTVPLEYVGKIARSCTRILNHHWNRLPFSKNVVTDCLWTVAALADDMNNGGIQTTVVCSNPDLLDVVMKILSIGDDSLYHGCLRILGNIATGNDEHTQFITSHPLFYENVLKAIDGAPSLRHEAAWLCSNVAASRQDMLEVLFFDNRLFEKILNGACNDEAPKLKKECIWTLLNMLVGADEDRAHWIVSSGVVFAFPHILSMADQRVVSRGLQTLIHLLSEHPHFAALVEDMKLIDKVNVNVWDDDVAVLQSCEELKRTLTRQLAGTSNSPGIYYFD